MEHYKESLGRLIKNIKFIIPVIITALLSFGFVLTHYSVNIDTLAYDKYFEQNELLAQGRFTAPFINKILGVMNFNPFFVDTLAVIFMTIAAILFCLLFNRVAKSKLNDIVYTIFACLFISYPLICEIFTYTPAGLSIGLGYCIVALSLMLGYESIFNSYSKIKAVIMQSVLLCLAVYLYESFAAVYLCGIFMIFIMEYIYNRNQMKLVELIKKAVMMLLPLVIAIILGQIIVKILMTVLEIKKSTKAQKKILYSSHGILGGIRNLVRTIVDSYFFAGFYYFPITMLLIGVIVYIILIIRNSVKEKNVILTLLFIGLGIATISLSIVQGMASPYRTCQTFAYFIAFIFMILGQDIIENCKYVKLKNTAIAVIFVLVFLQAKDLHRWFYINYQRYEVEKNVVIQIGNEIQENYDINKPVYFTNVYSLPDNIINKINVDENNMGLIMARKVNKLLGSPSAKFSYDNTNNLRYGETNVNSYIVWAITAFRKDNALRSVELVKLFNYLGYHIKAGDKEVYNEVVLPLIKEEIEHWPNKGSIFETEEYIIVNF